MRSEDADASGPTPALAAEVEQLKARVQELEAEAVRLTVERDAAQAALQQSRMARRIPAWRQNMNGRDV
jgi:cell division protein FtsB